MPQQQSSQSWNAPQYDAGHSYVWKLAGDLVELLDPRPGQRILDIGCGTGHLTAQIANKEAIVAGMDSSPQMIQQARKNYPHITFIVDDVAKFSLSEIAAAAGAEPFDSIFSNATLHWVKNAEAAAKRIATALKPGGRFVAEFGGSGNIQLVSKSIAAGLKAISAPEFSTLSPWYFPTIAQYAAILDQAGLDLTFASLFDRPTPVEGGVRSWVEMFGQVFLAAVPADKREVFFTKVEEVARPLVYHEGICLADYRRLRIVATRR